MAINVIDSKVKDYQYDAIVIGSGISGGWAAKELTEKGLNVLVLERGRMVKHGDYPTANLDKWDMPNNGVLTTKQLEDYPIQKKPGYNLFYETKDYWVKDTEHPYNQIKPFDWIRGYQLGGRSLIWGRQCYRWSDLDFEANKKESIAIDWPIRYKEIEKWYDYVEQFIGVSGQKEGLHQLPDGIFQPPMDLNCIEKHVRDRIKKQYNDRILTIGRVAHITKEGGHNGRGTCLTRNRCMRGCPYGAYFSSNASTIPAAQKTGKLTIRPYSIVHSLAFDQNTQKVGFVNVIDSETKESLQFESKIVFLNASTLNSAAILLQSKSKRFPNGLGNDSGELGHNIMDHHFLIGARGRSDQFKDRFYKGRRPNGIYVPRFRNVDSSTIRKDYQRGFQYQGGGGRESWYRTAESAKFGLDFKNELMKPGDWTMSLHGFGECLPYHENKMSLNFNKTDKWGLPTLDLDVEWKDNEKMMRKDMAASAAEMLENAGLKDVEEWERPCQPGLGIHEMGTARMGHNPKTSVLNKHNQIHAAKNVFITDGACMTSSACQNPSLTYMALTARAADYAVDQLNKGKL